MTLGVHSAAMTCSSGTSLPAAQLSKPGAQDHVSRCQIPWQVAQPAGFLYPPCLQPLAPPCPGLEHDSHLVGLVAVVEVVVGALQGQGERRFPL